MIVSHCCFTVNINNKSIHKFVTHYIIKHLKTSLAIGVVNGCGIEFLTQGNTTHTRQHSEITKTCQKDSTTCTLLCCKTARLHHTTVA